LCHRLGLSSEHGHYDAPKGRHARHEGDAQVGRHILEVDVLQRHWVET